MHTSRRFNPLLHPYLMRKPPATRSVSFLSSLKLVLSLTPPFFSFSSSVTAGRSCEGECGGQVASRLQVRAGRLATGNKDERVHELCCCRRRRNMMQLRSYNRRLVKLQLSDGADIQTAGNDDCPTAGCVWRQAWRDGKLRQAKIFAGTGDMFCWADRAMCYDGDVGAATVCSDREDE
ncbi:hypothetical protein ACQJBY_036329 [Aegilops geniculata]